MKERIAEPGDYGVLMTMGPGFDHRDGTGAVVTGETQ